MLEKKRRIAAYDLKASRLKTTFKRETRYLEVKKQDGKYNWFISRLKCNKKYARITFRGWNAPSKEQLRGSKAQTKAKRHQEGYEEQF